MKMNKRMFSATLVKVILVLGVSGISCWADLATFHPLHVGRGLDLDDPLHGYCAGAGQCIDNGTNSPTTNNPPQNFGFTVNGGPLSGDLLLDILVANNRQGSVTTYGITGTFSGTATLLPGDWTSGSLDAFVGISASPANPIGAFLPSTQVGDPGATGFSVYQLDAGTRTLQGVSSPNVSPLLNLTTPVPGGSYIVGFLNTGTPGNPNWVATANSGAIFEAPDGGMTVMLLGGALVALGSLRRKLRV
jgi:hypothetical protein